MHTSMLTGTVFASCQQEQLHCRTKEGGDVRHGSVVTKHNLPQQSLLGPCLWNGACDVVVAKLNALKCSNKSV